MANYSQDITNFLKEISEIREFDLETSLISGGAKKIRDETIKSKIIELSNKYPNLESPEKEYLDSLNNFYGVGDKKKYDYGEIEKGKTPLDTPIAQFDFTFKTNNGLMNNGILGSI